MRIRSWLFAVVGLVLGCTSSPPPRSGASGAQCVPGRQEACACPGGGAGAQACKQDGSGYEPCNCGAPVATTAPPMPLAARPCGGEEQECVLGDNRHGWCRKGSCKDICPPGMSYTHLDTACHPPCGPTCRVCREGWFCADATAEIRE